MIGSKGWICPICGRGLAPWVAVCPACGPDNTLTDARPSDKAPEPAVVDPPPTAPYYYPPSPYIVHPTCPTFPLPGSITYCGSTEVH